MWKCTHWEKPEKEKHTDKAPDTKNGRRDVAPMTYRCPPLFGPIGSILKRGQADYPIHSLNQSNWGLDDSLTAAICPESSEGHMGKAVFGKQ